MVSFDVAGYDFHLLKGSKFGLVKCPFAKESIGTNAVLEKVCPVEMVIGKVSVHLIIFEPELAYIYSYSKLSQICLSLSAGYPNPSQTHLPK